MSCTPVTPAMLALLEVLVRWPDVDVNQLRGRPESEQVQAWGWIMESGEPTGTGWAHAKVVSGGLVSD